MEDIKNKFNKAGYSKLGVIKQEVEQNNHGSRTLCEEAIIRVLDSNPQDPIELVYCVKFIKDLIETLNMDFISWVELNVLTHLEQIGRFQHHNKDPARGKQYFNSNPTKEQGQYGQTILVLVLECLQTWARWFPRWQGKETQFLRVYDLLLDLGVTFPPNTYFKEDLIVKIEQKILNQMDVSSQRQKQPDQYKSSGIEKAQATIKKYQELQADVETAFQNNNLDMINQIPNRYQMLAKEQSGYMDELMESTNEQAIDLAEVLLQYEEQGNTYHSQYHQYTKQQLTYNQFKANYGQQKVIVTPQPQLLQSQFHSQKLNNESLLMVSQVQHKEEEQFQQNVHIEQQHNHLVASNVQNDFKEKEAQYKQRIAEMQHQLSVYEVESDEMKQQLEQLRHHSNYKGQHEQGQQQIVILEQNIHQLKIQLSDVQYENQEYKNQNQQLRNRITQLEYELQQSQQHAQLSNQDQIDDYQDRLSGLHQKHTKLEQTLAQQTNEHEKVRQKYNELQQLNDQHQNTLQQQKLHSKVQDELINDLKRENDKLIYDNDRLNHDNNILKQEIERLKEEVLHFQYNHNMQNSSVNQNQHRISQLEGQLYELTEQYNRLIKELEVSAEQTQQLKYQHKQELLQLNEQVQKISDDQSLKQRQYQQDISKHRELNQQQQQHVEYLQSLHQQQQQQQQLELKKQQQELHQNYFELNKVQFNKLIDQYKIVDQPEKEKDQYTKQCLSLIYPISPSEYYGFREKKYSQIKGLEVKLSYTLQPFNDDYKNSCLLMQSRIYQDNQCVVYQMSKTDYKIEAYLLYFQFKFPQKLPVLQFNVNGPEQYHLHGQVPQFVESDLLIEIIISQLDSTQVHTRSDHEITLVIGNGDTDQLIRFKLPKAYMKYLEIHPQSTLNYYKLKWKAIQQCFKSSILVFRMNGLDITKNFKYIQVISKQSKVSNYLQGIGDIKLGFIVTFLENLFVIRLIIKPNNKGIIQIKSESQQQCCSKIMTELIQLLT